MPTEKQSHATSPKMCPKCTGLLSTPVSPFLSLVLSLHLLAGSASAPIMTRKSQCHSYLIVSN